MRNIYKLVEAIKNEVPAREKGFIRALDTLVDSAKYRAPEAYIVNFEQLSMIFENHLGDPKLLSKPWQKKVVGIFKDEIKILGMDYIER